MRTMKNIALGFLALVAFSGAALAQVGPIVGPGPIQDLVKGPTFQTFVSGTGATYTAPAGVKWIKVTEWGGGASGGSSSTSTGQANGTAGNATTFNSVVANGGSIDTSGQGGLGGVSGSGTATSRFAGGNGGIVSSLIASATTNFNSGGFGGFGGCGGGPGGRGGFNGAGGPGLVPGGGGGGAGVPGTISLGGSNLSGGSGGGECAVIFITNPAATYTYSVGAATTGATAGTGGAAGGNGATGEIIVEEHYNY